MLATNLRSQFPKIYRFIPELRFGITSFHLKVFFVSFISGFLLVAISLQGYRLLSAFSQLQTTRLERDQLVSNRAYWEDVVKRHPGYRDGYFKVALLSYQLGDLPTTKDYLAKTMIIDPTFVAAKAFAKRIGE